MDEKFNSLLSIIIVPYVVDLIIKKEHLTEIEAISKFYKSKTYAVLANEETKVWHYSPLTIYNMWKSEMETGDIIYPEE